MPPSAILLINKVRENTSAKVIDLRSQAAIEKRQWELSLQRQMERIYKEAARPNRGHIVADATSVLFQDRSELLACYCRAVSEAGVSGQWWWHSYFGSSLSVNRPADLVVESMLATPSLIPSITEQVIKWRCAEKLLRHLDKPDLLIRLISALLTAYDLTDFNEQLQALYSAKDEVLSKAKTGQPGSASREDMACVDDVLNHDIHSKNNDIRRGSQVDTLLPFGSVELQELASTLSKEKTLFLVIAQTLNRSPMALQSPRMQQRMMRWWGRDLATFWRDDDGSVDLPLRSILKSKALVERARVTPIDQQTAVSDDSVLHITVESPSMPSLQANKQEDGRRHDAENRELNLPPAAQSKKNATDTPYTFKGRASDKSDRVVVGDFSELESLESENAEPGSSESDDSQPAELDKRASHDKHSSGHYNIEDFGVGDTYYDAQHYLADSCCDTRLGGLFYLINLLQSFELPISVRRDQSSSQSLSRWAVLDAVSRALLGECFVDMEDDPVWHLLARLDRRENGTKVAEHVHYDHSHYRMSKSWFASLNIDSTTKFYWATHNGRLRIWCDAGVLVERDSDNSSLDDLNLVEEQVLQYLNDYLSGVSPQQIFQDVYSNVPLANARQIESLNIGTAFSGLLSFVIPSIQSKLQRALDLPDATGNTLLKHLLLCEAQLFLGPCHLDMVANVNSTSFAIRCSGLDQDPGWLPEYGRVVLFHFTLQ